METIFDEDVAAAFRAVDGPDRRHDPQRLARFGSPGLYRSREKNARGHASVRDRRAGPSARVRPGGLARGPGLPGRDGGRHQLRQGEPPIALGGGPRCVRRSPRRSGARPPVRRVAQPGEAGAPRRERRGPPGLRAAEGSDAGAAARPPVAPEGPARRGPTGPHPRVDRARRRTFAPGSKRAAPSTPRATGPAVP